jgi:hypothetical protein
MIHPALVSAAIWLAANTGDDGGGESKKSGPIGLVVIIVLCVVCYFLFKSLSKHLKKVRDDFPELPPTTTAPLGDSSDRVATPAELPSPPPERSDDGT